MLTGNKTAFNKTAAEQRSRPDYIRPMTHIANDEATEQTSEFPAGGGGKGKGKQKRESESWLVAGFFFVGSFAASTKRKQRRTTPAQPAIHSLPSGSRGSCSGHTSEEATGLLGEAPPPTEGTFQLCRIARELEELFLPFAHRQQLQGIASRSPLTPSPNQPPPQRVWIAAAGSYLSAELPPLNSLV